MKQGEFWIVEYRGEVTIGQPIADGARWQFVGDMKGHLPDETFRAVRRLDMAALLDDTRVMVRREDMGKAALAKFFEKTAPDLTAQEESAVRELGERIGYGRTMQLCEKLWSEKLSASKGGEHTVGPCAAFMVPCPHTGYEKPHLCDWCCGSGRVTKKVFAAMNAASGDAG